MQKIVDAMYKIFYIMSDILGMGYQPPVAAPTASGPRDRMPQTKGAFS
jgi:hypothetical protein